MTSETSRSEDLKTIRRIMEESSRFLSLSGLSGIIAGIIALAASVFAWFLISGKSGYDESTIGWLLFADSLLALCSAIVVAIILSTRKAIKQEQKIWTPITRRMLVNLSIPLIAGGFLILLFVINKDYEYIMPSMLLFYGLALVSASKFTFGEVLFLGVLEVLCGVFAGIFIEYALWIWSFGFGFLHILYGLIMHKKYS